MTDHRWSASRHSGAQYLPGNGRGYTIPRYASWSSLSRWRRELFRLSGSPLRRCCIRHCRTVLAQQPQSPVRDTRELLAAARDDAGLVLKRDANLTSARGRALRTLLYLFERDAAVKYLRSG